MAQIPPKVLEYAALPADAGERIDKVVARAAGISRQRAMELIADGRVRVGNHRPRKGDRTEAGAKIHVELPDAETPVPQEELGLDVLSVDAFLIAVDKPAGMNMHPLEAGERGTLANALIARYPDVVSASSEERCPGLIHRLDRDTSGVVLWARTRPAFDYVRAQFAAKTVEKRYLALVDGFVEGSGELNVPLAHDPADARRMVATPYPAEAAELGARPAFTRYRALAHADGRTLVEAEIPTGVMHQIRAHFAFVGYPICADTLYGGRPFEGLGRHFLHAASITFAHPATGERRRIDSPLPPDLVRALGRAAIALP